MMVEYKLNVDGWLDDVTLFNEPSSYSLNFDQQKTNLEDVPVTEFSEFPWFDENIDISILEDPSAQLDLDALPETAINDFYSFITSNLDNSYLTSEVLNSNFPINFDLDYLQNQVTSPGSSTHFPFSPEYESISEASSPARISISPNYDTISDVPSPTSIASADATFPSEFNVSSKSTTSVDEGSFQVDTPSVFVTVCDDADNEDSSPETDSVSIEEVSDSMRKRKFVNSGKEVPKVRISLKNNFHPYSKVTSKRRSDKSERKKVQNKEAAARYRTKKRIEDMELSGEVAGLEAEQKKLRSKHDDLETEIKYLKKLMREMLEKKGLL